VPDQPTPGPCPSTGCPPPTEIDCIMVTKLYDFCFQQDTLQNVCATISETCTGATTASCTVVADCVFVSSTPSSVSGFVDATFAIAATVTFTTTVDTTTCTSTTTATFTKTVTLCGPAGTTQTCTVLSANCTAPVIIDGTVCTSVIICATYQSSAYVSILVPTYGFCTPAPCTTLPSPPCPPSSLFPPQCT